MADGVHCGQWVLDFMGRCAEVWSLDIRQLDETWFGGWFLGAFSALLFGELGLEIWRSAEELWLSLQQPPQGSRGSAAHEFSGPSPPRRLPFIERASNCSMELYSFDILSLVTHVDRSWIMGF